MLVAKVNTLNILIRDPGATRLGVASKGLKIVFTRDANTNIKSCEKLKQVLLYKMLLAACKCVKILSFKLLITALKGKEAILAKSS